MTNLKLNWQILLLATDAAKQDWTRASLATSCLCSPQTTSCTLVAKTDPDWLMSKETHKLISEDHLSRVVLLRS